jgi:hypothetical protein
MQNNSMQEEKGKEKRKEKKRKEKKRKEKEGRSNKGLAQPTSQPMYPSSGITYKDTSTATPIPSTAICPLSLV